MAGYSRHWQCSICKEEQESADYPSVKVCERCLRPLANRLVGDMFHTPTSRFTIDAPGIDAQYWLQQATALAKTLLTRYKESE